MWDYGSLLLGPDDKVSENLGLRSSTYFAQNLTSTVVTETPRVRAVVRTSGEMLPLCSISTPALESIMADA